MRYEQRHDFLGHYVRSAAQGEFGIAAFQRPYVWTKEDVELYLESVCGQLPVGDFLLWKLDSEQVGDARLSKGRIGPIEHKATTQTLILDGQNRLSTIIWAARSAEAPGAPAVLYSEQELAVWRGDETLVADIEEQRIHFVPSSAAHSPTRFPLGRIMGGTILQLERTFDVFSAMRDAGIAESNLNWFLDDIPNHFRSKKISVTELSDATPEEALHAFLRICRNGQRITDEDIEAARRWMLDK
jgi:Uncharacterized conserved protein